MGPILVVETRKNVSMTGGSTVESNVLSNIIDLLQFFSSKSITTTIVVDADIQLVDYDTIEDKAFTVVDNLLIHHSIGTSIMVNAPPMYQSIPSFNLPHPTHRISVYQKKRLSPLPHENLASRR